MGFRGGAVATVGVPSGKFAGKTGLWYPSDVLVNDTNAVIGTQIFGGQQSLLIPFTFATTVSIQAWGFRRGAAASTLATGVRCGFWRSNALTGLPAQGAPDLEFPLLAAPGAGWNRVALAGASVLIAGRYWIGVGFDGTGVQSCEMEKIAEASPISSAGSGAGDIVNQGYSLRDNANGILANVALANLNPFASAPSVFLQAS